MARSPGSAWCWSPARIDAAGSARASCTAAIDDVAGAGLIPVLDATPAGRPSIARSASRMPGVCTGLPAARPRPASPAAGSAGGGCVRARRPIADAVWPALCAYDAAAFGADRSGVLARLRGRLPAAELFAERDGRVVGFAARPRRPHRTLSSDRWSPRMTRPRARCSRTPSMRSTARSISISPMPRPKSARWLEARGFAPQRPFTRMLRHRRASFDDPAAHVCRGRAGVGVSGQLHRRAVGLLGAKRRNPPSDCRWWVTARIDAPRTNRQFAAAPNPTATVYIRYDHLNTASAD